MKTRKMRLLLLDNFDSFVYNLYQYFGELGCVVDVVRNNEMTVGQIASKKYDLIVISPGPGSPDNKRDFGVCSDVIERLGPTTPILGVCLGHQGIVSTFGGRVIRANKPMHGKVSILKHNGEGLFKGLKDKLKVMRYHSLIAEEATLPDCLEITARSLDDGAIMGVRHKRHLIFGVQFHPESILTEQGMKLLQNFCTLGQKKA